MYIRIREGQNMRILDSNVHCKKDIQFLTRTINPNHEAGSTHYVDHHFVLHSLLEVHQHIQMVSFAMMSREKVKIINGM